MKIKVTIGLVTEEFTLCEMGELRETHSQRRIRHIFRVRVFERSHRKFRNAYRELAK